ncbi:MAG: HlyD family efflux transporter periplasmic adaptor subunit [Bacteroidales bacterium]|uniref:HlyD family secretion protein n=1 Tax=Porphyromonas sp. TaxID=1924944 RepID=UPI0029721FA4|nr:HlyD family efflux transporter periplasmic adaptor subunit [Porphyromonas sp.]MDD7437597.1 HlyD family efflux transporter periplasmic adaptor subunit [Bacteroidales bacterium]MDY3066369.1 HlyD family efflux transporter periplasmic adaptor subunit [Porphyromonas sp.]
MKKGLFIIALAILVAGCKSGNDGLVGSGSFEATEVLVSSEANGRVLAWDIEEGSVLKAGQQVGLIDTTQLYLQKEALLRSGKGVRAARPNVTTQTKAIEVQLEDLRAQKARTARLLEAGVATRKQLDDIETGIAALESQLAASRSTLSNSNAQISAQSSAIDVQVAQVDDLIARSVVRSPIDGTVTATYINRGELAGQGRPLFRVANLSEMYLRAYVQGDKLGKLKLGDTLEVQVDGAEGEKRLYDGVITWISNVAEFTPKTVQTEDERSNLVYAIKVKVANDGYLRIGMYGEVK